MQAKTLQRSSTMEKLKSFISKCRRRCKGSSRRSSSSSSSSSSREDLSADSSVSASDFTREISSSSSSSASSVAAAGTAAAPLDSVIVLVGKSRKPYAISSEFMEHPVIRVLIQQQQQQQGNHKEEEPAVACEVVLFDHLLWMLQNGGDGESLSELVDLYACDC